MRDDFKTISPARHIFKQDIVNAAQKDFHRATSALQIFLLAFLVLPEDLSAHPERG